MRNQAHKLPPGSRAPESGQYQIVDPRGGKCGKRTVIVGTRLPPTPMPGMNYVLIVPDSVSADNKPRVLDDVARMRRSPEDETAHLLASPENARFLRRSMAEAAAGKVVTVDPRDLGIIVE